MNWTARPSVLRLPPELLSNIFRTLTVIDPPTSKWTPKRSTEIYGGFPFHIRRRLGWIGVSHVCHPWRITVIGDAALWTYISGDLSMAWVAEMLCRSRGMPIKVSFEAVDIILPAFIQEALAPAPQRLTSLRLCPKQGSDRPALQQLTWPAPLLEELIIENSHHTDIIFRSADLFSSTLPRLCKLTLRGWMPDSWDVPYLCNLTSLTLEFNMSNTKWLEILGRCPKLETIEAKGIIRGSSDGEMLSLGEHGQVVELPSLRQIDIEASGAKNYYMNGTLIFFDHLLLPPTCKINLTFNTWFMVLPTLDTVFACFSSHGTTYNPRQRSAISRDARPSPKRLIITGQDYGIHYLNIEPHLDLTDEATFSVRWVHPDLGFEEPLLRAICTKVYLANVVFLKFAGNGKLCMLDTDILSHFLSSFPSVKTLVLSTKRITNIVSVLAESASGDNDQVDALLLPSLDVLVIEGVNLDKRSGEVALGTTGETVVKMLRTRRSLGAEMKSVELVGCEGSEESVNSIKQCVSNFVEDNPST